MTEIEGPPLLPQRFDSIRFDPIVEWRRSRRRKVYTVGELSIRSGDRWTEKLAGSRGFERFEISGAQELGMVVMDPSCNLKNPISVIII